MAQKCEAINLARERKAYDSDSSNSWKINNVCDSDGKSERKNVRKAWKKFSFFMARDGKNMWTHFLFLWKASNKTVVDIFFPYLHNQKKRRGKTMGNNNVQAFMSVSVFETQNIFYDNMRNNYVLFVKEFKLSWDGNYLKIWRFIN